MNEAALGAWRKAGAVSRDALEHGAPLVDEGVAYLEVAEEIEEFIMNHGAMPAFPVNISVNEVAAHYSPSTGDKLRFNRGDVVKLDVGAHVNGYIGDTATTIEVGTRNHDRLIGCARRALTIALEMIGEGVAVGTIGAAIERSIKEEGFRPVVNLTGHGMERYSLHAGLTIPNIDDGDLTRIRGGMVIAVEPFATDGAGQVSNGRPGNIYRVLRERHMKDKKALEFFGIVRERFGTLPFCERWCTRIDPRSPAHLRTLVRHGLISSYPVLKEIDKGKVSQAEHTVLLNGSKVEIIT